MTIPKSDIRTVQAWCERRVPEHMRDQRRVECDIATTHLTIIENRPYWRDESKPWTRTPVARLRYNQTLETWSVYWVDRNQAFHEYLGRKPVKRVSTLLKFMVDDPDGIFWG
jgi:hypothetical protein